MNILELIMNGDPKLESMVSLDQELQNIILNDFLFEIPQEFP